VSVDDIFPGQVETARSHFVDVHLPDLATRLAGRSSPDRLQRVPASARSATSFFDLLTQVGEIDASVV